ncbi:ATP-binding protein [Actinocrispum wychmicini]|uniref:Regulatory LuxR family protein n=1 Tax=Actinocrispum wychmicini TaxID=1213861 RepID=A0A4R2JDQ8_9PSEU|nr:AAA family ATPase [Actinocrispum wychmicini]TCO54339.1 regulatory LuxR family protein [Actinocrispum wychmicini]
MEPRLTGRDSEKATLAGIVDQAERGVSQLVLLSGQPGIGKTRLAGHALRTAAERGFTLLVGQADPLQAGLAYAPMVAALRGKLDEELVAGLDDLGRLLPDPRLPQPRSGGDPAANRSTMFEAVVRLLCRMAERAPVLMFVDDLHWADPGTIELIHHLGDGMAGDRLVVLGASRTPPPESRLADLAALVRRHDNGTELALGPLSEADVRSLAQDVLGAQPPPAMLRELAARTKGVPLFVMALARHTGHGPLPTIVRDVVMGRLEALSEAERDLVDLIAVAGSYATVDVLRTATRGDIEAELQALQRDGHVEAHLSDNEVAYRVAHPLYAEVAYADLTEIERRRLHATLARTIDASAPDNIMAIAPHYRDAGDYVDPQRAIDVLATAGERALNLYAATEAVDYLARALSRARTDRPALVPDLLNSLGLAYQGAGMLDAATKIWQERLANEPDLDRQISLRLHLAIVESERGNLDHADAHVTALLGHAGEHDIQSLGLRMVIAARRGDLPRAFTLFKDISETYGDSPRPPARAMALYARGALAAVGLKFDEAHRLMTEAAAIADDFVEDNVFLKHQPRRILAGLCVLMGDIPGAIDCVTKGMAVTSNFALPSGTYAMGMVRTTSRYFAGDLLGSLRDLDAYIASSSTIGLDRNTARMLAHRAFLLAELGRIDEAAASLDQARRWLHLLRDGREYDWEIATTMIAVHSGHPEEAPPLDALAFTFRDPIINCMRVLVAAQAANAANDHAAATHIMEHLRKIGRTAPLLDALADRQEGLLTSSSDLLRNAARRLDGMGAPLLSAQAALEAAELDPDQDAITDCLTRFQNAGATPWLERTRSLARKHKIGVAIDRTTGHLTRREQEIVHLVGTGLSNADIATRLFLSERTVESHLRNSYRKLGITSRLRLAQWAAAND